jgi:hypothetical protein
LPEHRDQQIWRLFDRVLALAAERHFLRVDEIGIEDRDRPFVGRDHLQRRRAIGEHDRWRDRPEHVLVESVLDDNGRARGNRPKQYERNSGRPSAEVHDRI